MEVCIIGAKGTRFYRIAAKVDFTASVDISILLSGLEAGWHKSAKKCLFVLFMRDPRLWVV